MIVILRCLACSRTYITLLHENFAVSRSSLKNCEIKMLRKMHFELNREIKIHKKPLGAFFRKVSFSFYVNSNFEVRFLTIDRSLNTKCNIPFCRKFSPLSKTLRQFLMIFPVRGACILQVNTVLSRIYYVLRTLG